MPTHCHRFLLIMFCTVFTLTSTSSLCSAQGRTSRQSSPAPLSVLKSSKNQAALELLTRLRAIRDCWADSYMILPSNTSSDENDSLFLMCGTEYRLRLMEAQAAVADAADAVNDRVILREAAAAIVVFTDLDTLYRLFNSRGYFFSGNVRISDIYPIVHKYNLAYNENSTSKVAIYRQMMPHRRTHIDRLAELIAGAPADSNPTLTPAQAEAATDDLTWSRAAKSMAYEWYLGRYPQGRHAAEARNSNARKSEILKERNEQIESVRRDLEDTTHKVLQAYVRGDKVTYGSYLSNRFPAREIYIAKLKAQPEVTSFEITDFEIKPFESGEKLYRTTMNVRYTSIFNKQRDYHNSILYLKNDRGWEIVEWR